VNASRGAPPVGAGSGDTKATLDTTGGKDSAAPLHLRERILATSRELLDRDGVAGLSMREVARQTGVTHQAPYHYFQDRESILAELVTRGFTELGRRLALANDLATTHGKRAALMASGEAYVGFAMEQPGVFRIMFRPDVCDPSRFPLITEAGEKAYGELMRLVQIMHGTDSTQSLSTVYWAHVHGMALLMLDGPLSRRIPDVQARMAHMHDAGRHFADMMLGKGY
jgi:AcrR family transcriptional regulator